MAFSAAQASSSHVLITPYHIYAESETEYLRDGIAEILRSRLMQPPQIVVMGRDALALLPEEYRQPAEIKDAHTAGQLLQADYVVWGTVAIFGRQVSVNTQLARVEDGRTELVLSEQGADLGDIIPIISGFATTLKSHILGVPETATVEPSDPAGDLTPAELDVRAHPLKLADQIARRETGELRTPTAHDFMATPQAQRQLRLIWRSGDRDASITAVALGDVTGDGRIETVVADNRSVHLFRGDDGALQEIETLAELRRDHIVALDIADINGNGFAEIFVSALHVSRERASSFVLEFNGKTFERRVSDSPWFYRVARNAAGEPELYAQNQTGGPLKHAIVNMHWQAGDYQAGERVLPGGQINVLGFTVAHLENTPHQVVAYNNMDFLELLDRGGERHWRSLEPLGGSLQYALLAGRSDGDIEQRHYLPMRVKALTLQADTADEILAVRNHEVARRLLAQFRHYSHAQILSHGWDGVGLAPLWQTRDINGRIADFAVGNMFNDGRLILLLGVVTREGLIVGTRPRSVLMAFELRSAG